MLSTDMIENLPGAKLILQGLTDVAKRSTTLTACLIEIAHTRFIRASLLPEDRARFITEPELCLYRLLCSQCDDAYSKYNSLIRELISFENALDRLIARSKRRI